MASIRKKYISPELRQVGKKVLGRSDQDRETVKFSRFSNET
jgi:hypothetical protein